MNEFNRLLAIALFKLSLGGVHVSQFFYRVAARVAAKVRMEA